MDWFTFIALLYPSKICYGVEMKTDSVLFAAKAKGPLALLKRVRKIAGRYGLTPTKMDQALHLFAQTLAGLDCGASFPITAVALKRNSSTIARYLDQNIEFAVHGYTHIDYSRQALDEQLVHLNRAREAFAAIGIKAVGFRSPYLRRGADLYSAIKAAGFSYVSNQPFMWDALDTAALPPSSYAGYERALDFYVPWFAHQRPSLPRLDEQLVEIPVSLPDDEILLDRLGGESTGLVEKTWRRILAASHQRGELFTIQLHPERIAGCVAGLSAVLTEARALTPAVWCARLDEIASWWRDRTAATVDVSKVKSGALRLSVKGPPGTTILARSVNVVEPTEPWGDGYQRIKDNVIINVHCEQRPFIGVSPGSSPALANFLRQQGYIVHTAAKEQPYACYLDQPDFAAADELALLTQIENGSFPLVRLGRWPCGARSALAVSGDIDALTIWDYGLRFLGK
jgi:peptidoglycan/xylan/chitin deacetylase (PgdA/CDA1 family)